MVAMTLVTAGVPALIAVLAALRYGLGTYAWIEANKLERPRYTVVEKFADGVELRHYDEYMVAEVSFKRPPSMKNATSAGFRKVAGYIFGKNVARGSSDSLKMAMTAPVRMALKGDLETASPDEVS
jgi:hypothetical protein